MTTLTIPAEGTYSDIERDFIDNELPGLFPQSQDSVWGQMRKLFAGDLQSLSDLLTQWYLNQDPSTVDINDIGNWEAELGIPYNAANRTLQQRQSFVQSRRQRGAFTRTRRRLLVESFISATFGAPITFTSDGLAFDSGGMPFYAETVDLSTAYRIVENIPAFSYDVRILNTIAIDQPGLQRELERITPAHLTFTITLVASL